MKILKEPLLHFLLIGAAFFAAFQFLGEPEPAGEEIVVSSGTLESIAANFSKTWQRPPSPEEMEGLVDAYVREEMMSREAVKLGLDADDEIIRRRLGQKMDFILSDLGEIGEPTDAELSAYLESHADKYRDDSRYSLRQIYFSTSKRGEEFENDAKRSLSELRENKVGASESGDPTLLPLSFEDASATRIDGTFGEGFAAKLSALPAGEWSGPFVTGFGGHLIFIESKTPGTLPPLGKIRAELVRDWTYDRREEFRERQLDEMLGQYKVVIEDRRP